MPPNLPSDVLNSLKAIFADCNHRISKKLSDNPNIHEESLDFTFIETFSHFEAPMTLPSGWTLRFETHFLGGGRHFGNWEIADIGLLVMVRSAGKTAWNKVALLQSKRLYPDETDFEEGSIFDYMIGFRRLFEQDDEWAELVKPRIFTFSQSSRYKALKCHDGQYKAIELYEQQTKIPIYYLLYNPCDLPWSISLPLTAHRLQPQRCDVGCRVLPSEQLREVLSSRPENYLPAYDELAGAAPAMRLPYKGNWRLEDFAVDLLLGCHAGHVAKNPEDAGLDMIFNRRSGPISAAISITVDAPADFRWE
jgi:hypothetical protein